MPEHSYMLREVKLELTHDCMLKCLHCSSMSETQTGRMITFEECIRVIDEASELGVKNIAFSGGEPFLWRKLPDAIEYARKKDMYVSVYTTGYIDNVEPVIKAIKKAGANSLMFSMYSVLDSIHDAVTTIKGSLKATVDAINFCKKYDLNTEIHFVPMSGNLNELEPICEKSTELSVKKISILRLVPQGRSCIENIGILDRNENFKLREIIEALRKKGFDIRVGSPFNALLLKDNPQCNSGIDRLTISPELNIFPCDAFKQVTPAMLGVSSEFTSLRTDSLSDCWEKSEYLKKIREYLNTPFPAQCASCFLLKKCNSGCLAQKFYQHGTLAKTHDPMCLNKKIA